MTSNSAAHSSLRISDLPRPSRSGRGHLFKASSRYSTCSTSGISVGLAKPSTRRIRIRPSRPSALVTRRLALVRASAPADPVPSNLAGDSASSCRARRECYFYAQGTLLLCAFLLAPTGVMDRYDSTVCPVVGVGSCDQRVSVEGLLVTTFVGGSCDHLITAGRSRPEV